MKCLGLATLWITGKLFCVGLLLQIVQSNFFFLSEMVLWHKQISLLNSFLRPASRVTPPFIQ